MSDAVASDAAPAPPTDRPGGFAHSLAYALSVPERLIRALVSALGGLALILARLLPRPLREARFYKITVERQIKMLTDDVGRAGIFKDHEALDARTATRMTVGGAVDNLFLIGLHASPIWILLAATDVTREASAFTHQLGEELKKAGVMREGSRLDSVDDVLEGLSTLSTRLADTMDKPPLSLDEMKATVGALREELGEVADDVSDVTQLEELSRELLETSQQSDRSLLELTSALATSVLETGETLVRGSVVTATATLKILGRRLWKDVALDYHAALRSIHRRGFYGSLRVFLKPQSRGLRALFRYRFLSFTEIGVSFGKWRKAAWRV